MPINTSIKLFAEGIKPMWEGEICKDGGKWSFSIPKTDANQYWEDLCKALIKDQFTDEKEVMGIIIQLKPAKI